MVCPENVGVCRKAPKCSVECVAIEVLDLRRQYGAGSCAAPLEHCSNRRCVL